jgi:conjugal transfer pilus assembly protein TraB
MRNGEIPHAKYVKTTGKTDPFYQPMALPFSASANGPIEMEQKQLRSPIREVSIGKKQRKVFPVAMRIPSGASARALLVSSVDAVCGVYSNSDPIPVKLRLLDDGHLPKGVEAALKGCLIIGSAFGNISSERVYIRLERLTKVNKEGEAIETEVAGYVSGEDGKFGVRGTVVDRSGKILKNAAASGILGGIAQALQASVARQPVDCWNTYAVGVDSAKKGVANGTSSAFDLLADYYIRRAEQVQPVLQVNAGRIVDITFTHGFEMGDLHTKEKIGEVRARSRRGST